VTLGRRSLLAAVVSSPVAISANARIARGLLLDIAWTGQAWLACGEAGRILRSTNGLDWQVISTEVSVVLTALIVADARTVWAVGHQGMILGSSDGGITWVVEHREAGAILLSGAVVGGRVLAVGAYGLALARDGRHWHRQGIVEDDVHLNVARAGGDTLWVGGEGGVLLTGRPGALRAVAGIEGSVFALTVTADGVVAGGLGGRLARVSNDESVRPLSAGALTWQGACTLPDGRVVAVGLGGAVAVIAGERVRLENRSDRIAHSAVAAGPGGVFAVGEAGLTPLVIR
jgi:hypothetical protein